MISTNSSPALTRAIPVLASTDLDATKAFYAQRLRFEVVATYDDYAVLARDGIQLHFWLTDDRAIAENTSCRIDVSGIEALYAEMEASGVVHRSGLQQQPWGVSEFHVIDGDGNALRFQERISA